MNSASWPRGAPLAERLLHVDPDAGRWRDAHIGVLPSLLRAGDLLVVNDSATLPASLRGSLGSAPVEARLAGHRVLDPECGGASPRRASAGGAGSSQGPELEWDAVLFGAGDWRTRTEDRPAPPAAQPGDRLVFGADLSADVERVAAVSPRLVSLRFHPTGDAFWTALYRHGRPVQYAYAAAPLELWHAQSAYATRPWSVEAPSAGRPLTPTLLASLVARGIHLATLTHAAGLSSTGDAALDAALPLPERYDLPASTVAAVDAARARGGRVIAVGTTVVRALEGCARAHAGRLVAGEGVTDLRLGAAHRLAIVDGLLTGMHEPTTSHYALLGAFASRATLDSAHTHASRSGYLAHEFGDSMLIVAT